MRGLPASALPHMHAAARAIRDGAPARAEQLLTAVLAGTPDHPEALRLFGILRNRQQRFAEAARFLEQTLQQRPDDTAALSDMASALYGLERKSEAFEHWREACRLRPDFALGWFNLGRNLQQEGITGEAVDALREAVRLAPDMLPAHVLLGDALVHLGRFDEADASYRAALKLHPANGDAWRGLSNMKTRPLSEDDAARLQEALEHPAARPPDRIAMRHALGKLHEDRGRHAEAFDAIARANRESQSLAAWNRDAFHRLVEAVAAQDARLAGDGDTERGREAIFIVGMPRAGSTLVEQMLAAHPQVEGASELPDLGVVLAAETARRKKPFPAWLGEADADDWARLGHDYLQRTARWRSERPRHTDKMPENWLYTGLLRAMLPGAIVIDARRDALETGWSCFKQQFYRLPHFSNDLHDLAAYLRDYERSMDAWRAREPERVVLQCYEDLLADPDTQIRALLDACGLPFDDACLHFHKVRRSVRTASAAQVRQPLQRDTARAERYGSALDPLRHALADPDNR
ncbi:tetratricopeptide repeat-containing sulfotransferase family protein [Oleiagrimonas soli]|nr:sulfotransferase [Oleiagrimonas soli]MBB6183150.1 tetratricopeptide (TPR) repeat protein [Oleiagrimonas soli]